MVVPRDSYIPQKFVELSGSRCPDNRASAVPRNSCTRGIPFLCHGDCKQGLISSTRAVKIRPEQRDSVCSGVHVFQTICPEKRQIGWSEPIGKNGQASSPREIDLSTIRSPIYSSRLRFPFDIRFTFRGNSSPCSRHRSKPCNIESRDKSSPSSV